MYIFICTNKSCAIYNKPQKHTHLRYIATPEGTKCKQKVCTYCKKDMKDVTSSDGFPSNGVFKGSSNF